MNSNLNFFTDGEAYERMMGRWSRSVGVQFLDWLGLPQGLRWLDVGCGTGAFTETLIAHRAPGAVQGIDPSDAQIAYARTRDAAKLATFDIGDAQELPFEEASFDAAVMALVISFIPEPSKAVAEMARVVRRGGWVATYIWDVPGGGLPMAPFRSAAEAIGVPVGPPLPGSAGTREQELRTLWQCTGLNAVETRRIDIEVVYDDFEDFWQSNTALANPSVQYVRTLSASDVERLKDWLEKSLPKDSNGRISYGAHVNAVKGQVPD